jgi:L-lactate dehydrogenase complex protein LldG
MDASKENILKRARRAVAAPAPRRFEQDAVTPRPEGAGWFAPVGEGTDALKQRFAAELAELKGEFLEASSASEANGKLRELVTRFAFKKIAAQDTPELRGLLNEIPVKWLGHDVSGGRSLQDFDLGITCCDALAARTGSVVLTARSAGGRALSVLPPNHLVVARREQLVADLKDALQLLRRKHGDNLPSFTTVITGPSRTSDIEKMLVLGAHGPKRLFVLLIP